MAETTLGNVLEFFRALGVYDIILPFILTFTIVFAILERTRVFGTEKIGETEVTKKNLNAMVAFVLAFLVVASSKLVATITAVSSEVIVLLLLSVFFLMLVGTFHGEDELKQGMKLENPWKAIFFAIMFIGIAAIFLDAIKTEAGNSWLEVAIGVLLQAGSSTGIAAILLLIVMIAIVVFITWPKKSGGSKPPQ
ncbi:hypothetical protein KY329_00965 [Candidatus Woesearchaeota archaeon]|nr:hypothetical protein [Candidatus Woesearchaeota archaeon]